MFLNINVTWPPPSSVEYLLSMKVSINKITDKHLVIRYQKGYDSLVIITVVSLFLAGLTYWFIAAPTHFDEWKYSGPLMKRTPNEVLFRMPLLNSHKIIYVPLDDLYIKEKKQRYSLVFIGRTSEKLNINRKYTFAPKTYKTKEDARIHLKEALEFLKSSDPIFLKFRTPIPDDRTFKEKWVEYLPFSIAGLIILVTLLKNVTSIKLDLDKNSGHGKLRKGSLLFSSTKKFSIDELVDASVDKKTSHDETILTLVLHLKNKDFTICTYKPPYKDDKWIAGLSQQARLITWWTNDEINKYEERKMF